MHEEVKKLRGRFLEMLTTCFGFERTETWFEENWGKLNAFCAAVLQDKFNDEDHMTRALKLMLNRTGF